MVAIFDERSFMDSSSRHASVYLDDLVLDADVAAVAQIPAASENPPPSAASLSTDECDFYFALIHNAYRASKYIESGRAVLDLRTTTSPESSTDLR